MSIPPRCAVSALACTVLVLAGCPGAPEHRDILGTEKKLYSQSDEELVIRDFFQDRRGGFFLDVGAGDPVENSNTYYLEKHLDWSGIAIDALFEYHLVWRLQRPRSEYLIYLVSDHSGSKETFYRTPEKALSSVQPDRVFEGVHLGGEPQEVETTTLDYFTAHGYERIDRYLAADSINWYFRPRSQEER